MQNLQSFAPLTLINQIIPVWNNIINRTTIVTVRDTAIHTACALLTDLLVYQWYHKFLIMPDTAIGWGVAALIAGDFHKSGRFTHSLFIL
ncbi:hypothetical protein THIOM_005580 [Candidatus Thiomargarita nelsonii]|uniref:Uncharacterized protein n=1 Tax=Candidatus Thiomargarita nelsonii TaxID=1003181 RepID=A0A176RSY1_9GAMM|nr:hypothetical protein THIOM_005580 [Candidatus Thiomargarita nelsonii]